MPESAATSSTVPEKSRFVVGDMFVNLEKTHHFDCIPPTICGESSAIRTSCGVPSNASRYSSCSRLLAAESFLSHPCV